MIAIARPRLQWRIAALRNGFRDATAYQWEFVFEIVGSALVPAMIQWLLWYAIFKVGGAKEIAGMSYIELLHYTWMSILFSQVRGGDNDFELQEMIRTGQLSNYLLRPVGVVEFVWIRGIAPKLFIAAAGLGIGMLASPFLGVSPFRMVGAMFLALIGNIIHYQIGSALATSAFIWEEAFSILMVKNMLVNLLSGELLPLTLFPASMSWIWKSTPFYLYVFGPVEYATGKWTDAEFVHQLWIAGLWLLVGWALVRISWALGIKRYLSLGG